MSDEFGNRAEGERPLWPLNVRANPSDQFGLVVLEIDAITFRPLDPDHQVYLFPLDLEQSAALGQQLLQAVEGLQKQDEPEADPP